jgi:pimeloyl-ACP methyl ester carboxylesterase
VHNHDDEAVVTGDGVRLATTWWRADGASAAVVLVHGFAAHRHDGAVVAAADALCAAGYDVLTFDGRGHGESEGLCTLGDLERFDVDAAVDRAAHDHQDIVVVGASMGAIAALRFAAADGTGALRGVVTVSAPATWQVPRTAQSILAAGLTQTAPGRAIARKLMNVRLRRGWTRPEAPADLVGRIEAPLVLVHGCNDRFIRPAEADVLAAASHGPVVLDLVADMGHAFDARSRVPIVDGVGWCLAQSRDATDAVVADTAPIATH